MKQILRKVLLPFTVSALVLVGGGLYTESVSAATNPLDRTCSDPTLSGSDVCNSRNDKLFGKDSFWTRLINTFIFIVGTIAVLMMVVGGLRYVLSGGDASQTKSAKDTILYAIIGVVIALMAYAIVNFVVVELVG